MYIYGKFINEAATVTVSIYTSATDTAIVTNDPTLHVGEGMYKYNFSTRDITLDYRIVFTNTTDDVAAVGSVNAEVLADLTPVITAVDAIPLDTVKTTDPRLDKLTEIQESTTDIEDGLLGSWRIENNQLIMARPNGDILRTFDLKDEAGSPTSTSVYKRDVV